MPTDAPSGAADCPSRGAVSMYDGLAELLPAVRPPWWVQYIGEPYVCDNEACDEHRECLDRRHVVAPRAMCGCHNCAQRRWQKQREATTRAATTSPEGERCIRRNQRKRSRFERQLAGERTRVTRAA